MSDNELLRFIKYMSSLWALLAGVTAISPLSDVLLEVPLLPVDAYQKSTAPVAIPVTTLVPYRLFSFIKNKENNLRKSLIPTKHRE
jgi:hypothetical protein